VLIFAIAFAVVWVDGSADKVVFAVEPFSDAEMVTVWLDAIAPEAIATKAFLLPAGMVTEAGAVTPVSVGSIIIATASPPAGAAAARETTHVVPASELIEVTGQASEDSVTIVPVSKEIDVLADDPLSEAVTVAVELAAIAPVLIMNTALAAPSGTVTDVGTVSKAELEANVTVAPPSSAARLRKTKQFV
jgi:hypothetical protein